MTPQQYVQDKAAASGSSFYYAFRFLPPPRRAAITAFYAFCREVDDVVDEMRDPGVAASKLQWWRQEVHKAYAGTPTHPVMRALMPCAEAFRIEARQLEAVIDGCQIDLEQTRFLDYAGAATLLPSGRRRRRRGRRQHLRPHARRRPSTMPTGWAWRCS